MEIIIFVAFILVIASVSINVLLFWYIRRLIDRSSLVLEATNEVFDSLDDFSAHMEHIYELPLFYGDETLKALLQHSREMVQEMKEYKEGFIFDEEEEEFFDEDAEEDSEE